MSQIFFQTDDDTWLSVSKLVCALKLPIHNVLSSLVGCCSPQHSY